MSWHKVVKALQPFVVKVESPEGSGTGFLFWRAQAGALVGLATACHVVQRADEWQLPLRVTHYATGDTAVVSHEKRAVLLDERRDSATLILHADALPKLPTAPPTLIAADKMKKVGVEIGWVGFPSVAPDKLCFFSGRVSATLDDDDAYLIDGVAINGVSGGPVFDEDVAGPKIVGLVSAYHLNLQPRGALPGLLRAQDVTHLHKFIQGITSFEEAKAREKPPEAPAPPRE